MSKKSQSSGYPRKFVDKIALIKQKEALTNAYFESAIQGLSDISMKRISTNEDFQINNNQNYRGEINKVKDNFSNASVSPQSFTSDSTSINPHYNENYFQGNIDNLQEPEMNIYRHLYETPSMQPFPHYSDIKFRHVNQNSNNEISQTRFSNIEEYFHHNNSSVRDLNEQVYSGSLPDVSTYNNQNYVQSNFTERQRANIADYEDVPTKNSINFKEVLSSLNEVKKSSNSKKALFEHLRNSGAQNFHPHHLSLNSQTNSNLFGNPSGIRNRTTFVHSHDNFGCAATSNETGHLKHYLPSNSPYLSLPVRDSQSNNDYDCSFRKRHASGNIISHGNNSELQVNCPIDVNNPILKNKSLTPTENLPKTWFNNTNLLPTKIYGMISADNYRRVASDSSIQNSLKQCTNDISQAKFLLDTEANSLEKTHNFRNTPKANYYQRIKSMTSNLSNDFQETVSDSQKNFNFQPDYLTLSSFLDNYTSTNSPDENLDPNFNFIVSPGKVACQSFKFGDVNHFAAEPHRDVHGFSSCINNNNDLSQNTDQSNFYDMIRSTEGCAQITFENENNENQTIKRSYSPEHNDQCYWTQQTESSPYSFSKESSPKIKPCENLDPQNVTLDLNTDFSCLPDIVLSDEEAQRRDSLKMADEVLSNLNMDSGNSEFIQFRDKLIGNYQPMDVLPEETFAKTLEKEY